MEEDDTNKDKPNKKAGFNAMALVFELGGIIAVPIVVLGIFGRSLDKRFDMSPLFLMAAIVTSLIISGILAYRKVRNVID